MNEAITEDMNISMLKGNVHSADYLVSYPHERYVLEEVSDTFNIDKKLFYQMLISRKGSIEKVARQLDI